MRCKVMRIGEPSTPRMRGLTRSMSHPSTLRPSMACSTSPLSICPDTCAAPPWFTLLTHTAPPPTSTSTIPTPHIRRGACCCCCCCCCWGGA
eukprot:851633-Rhodomonas_salina.1